MSGIFGSTTIKGTRITDFAKTSADVGSTIPFLYGRAPVTGNVIFAHLPPDEHRQVKRQGKGGVKQETFTYTTSYAIAFCRGPIQGYWWIKRNGKVVYSQDPSAPIEDKDYAAKWAAKVMMYNGTSGQLPNSMIESYKGSGRVSAFKYLAYIAVPNEDVTEGGGAIPSYEAVPIASPQEVWITSTPYAQIFYSEAKTAFAPTGGELVRLLYDATMQSDEVTTGFGPTGGELFEVPPPEFNDAATVAFGPTGGELKTPPPQQFFDAATAGFAPSGGSLAVPPLGTMQKDEVTAGFGPTGGALVDVYSGTHAYWRVNVTSANSHCSIIELEMATSAGGANVCTGGTVIASGQYAGAQHDPAWAFDGILNNDGNTWASDTAQSGWLGYHFAAPVWIDEMRIAGRVVSARQSPRNFSLQWSDDGVTWYTTKSYTNQTFTDYTFNAYSTI